jgi:hypothetical protein
VGIDKVLHFVVSFLLARVDPVLAAVAGIGKEIWDALGHGTPSGGDLLADLLGILTSTITQ